MARPLKVYGWNLDGRLRAVVAATSWKAAAEAAGSSASLARAYGCETGNPLEVRIALARPGVAFYLHARARGNPTADDYHTDPKEARKAYETHR